MKKLLIVLLSLILITGCSKAEEPKVEDPDVKVTTEDNKETKKEDVGIEVDKNILSVDVTLPLSFMVEEGEDIEASLNEARKGEGINSVTLNDNNTVTYNMTKSKHKEMMESIEESLKESSDELINDSENSILKIENSSDYKSFDIFVDPDKYNQLEMFNALLFYMQGIMYNSFNGNNDAIITVKFINNETGEIIEEGNSSAFMEYTSDTETNTGSKEHGNTYENDRAKIVIKDYDFLTGIYNDAPIIALTIEFTNKDNEPIDPWFGAPIKAEQETDITVELLDGANGLYPEDFKPDLVKMGSTKIKPGATVDAVIGFELKIPDSPIYIRDWNNKYEYVINP